MHDEPSGCLRQDIKIPPGSRPTSWLRHLIETDRILLVAFDGGRLASAGVAAQSYSIAADREFDRVAVGGAAGDDRTARGFPLQALSCRMNWLSKQRSVSRRCRSLSVHRPCPFIAFMPNWFCGNYGSSRALQSATFVYQQRLRFWREVDRADQS